MDISSAISESFSFGYPSKDGNSIMESPLALYQFCEDIISTTFASTQGTSPLVPIVHQRPLNESGIAEASTPLQHPDEDDDDDDDDDDKSLDGEHLITPEPSVEYCSSSSSSFDPTKSTTRYDYDADYIAQRTIRQPAVRVTSRPLAIACGFDPLLDNEGRRVVVIGRPRSESLESATKENQQLQQQQQTHQYHHHHHQYSRSPWRQAKSDSRLLLPEFEK